MKAKVKICGIRSLEVAQSCVAAGTDYLGFNFVRSSTNYISMADAKKIIAEVRCNRPKVVGVFANEAVDRVNQIADFLQLDYVQLHGNELTGYCRMIKAPLIKAFGLHSNFDPKDTLKDMKRYRVDFYLVDRIERGSGKMLDLAKARHLTKQFKLFFAGGLTPDNVSEVIRKVKPYAVDVSSGVELGGEKDVEKINQFIRKAK